MIINSDKNCQYCLFFRSPIYGLDGSIITGRCLVDYSTDFTKYRGVLCPDWTPDPKNPLPKPTKTEEQKEAERFLRKKWRGGSRRPIKMSRNPREIYPLTGVKSSVIKSKKKLIKKLTIMRDNERIRELVDRLFALSKRSSAEGRKIRRDLRKLGFYISKGGKNGQQA